MGAEEVQITALVTGGGGFLGKAICKQLLARGVNVRSFSRGDYPELKELGVDHRRGDLANLVETMDVVEGCDIVYHTAALPGIWGSWESYYRANVVGTENIIQACQKHGVKKLVYTSSPSVVSNGKDLDNVDESQPYGEHFEAHYPATKAEAERKVLAANSEELATVALRPHLIWGPGDHHIIPRLVARSKAGKLRQIGHEDKLIDTVYVDNAAEAHLLAGDHLEYGSACAGKAYFITQDEPRPCWELINQFLAAAGAPPVKKKISVWFAMTAARVLETVYSIFGLSGEPPLTRFMVMEMTTSHYFNISAAKRDFNYQPKISIDEGLKRLAEAFGNHEFDPTKK